MPKSDVPIERIIQAVDHCRKQALESCLVVERVGIQALPDDEAHLEALEAALETLREVNKLKESMLPFKEVANGIRREELPILSLGNFRFVERSYGIMKTLRQFADFGIQFQKPVLFGMIPQLSYRLHPPVFRLVPLKGYKKEVEHV